jgi:hypothetical protein
MSAADLAAPLIAALLGDAAITSQLAAYKGAYPVFNRRPVPVGAPYPMIVVSPDIVVSDQDGIDDFRPIQDRDIAVYGLNSDAAKYRTVEDLAYAVRELFHSVRTAITVPGWHVININASGPVPAPTDDDQTIARLVTLRVELAKQ